MERVDTYNKLFSVSLILIHVSLRMAFAISEDEKFRTSLHTHGNKVRKKNVNFRSLFTTKDALQTTVVFIRCLVYLIVHGKRVDKVY